MAKPALYEAGVSKKPKNYELFRMFNPNAYMGKHGRHDTTEFGHNMKHSDEAVIERLYQRFPSLKMMPNPAYYKQGFGLENRGATHPAQTFVNKYKALVKKGWNKETAFEEVEKELRGVLEAQRDDMRILRGAALTVHGNSYLDRAQ